MLTNDDFIAQMDARLAVKAAELIRELERRGYEPVIVGAYEPLAASGSAGASRSRTARPVAGPRNQVTADGRAASLGFDIVDRRWGKQLTGEHRFWSELGTLVRGLGLLPGKEPWAVEMGGTAGGSAGASPSQGG